MGGVETRCWRAHGVRVGEVTLSECLSRGLRGRDCCVLRVICSYFKEVCKTLKFGLRERCLRGVMKGLGLWDW